MNTADTLSPANAPSKPSHITLALPFSKILISNGKYKLTNNYAIGKAVQGLLVPGL